MFSSKPNFLKLRTNLRLCINRLKLLEKKKSELALKSRVEIADFIRNGKLDRARIRVESIVREDYLVEAMEMVEMFCDLVLARFGLIEKMAELDPGIEEAVASIFWVTPRLSSDVPELKEVSQQLAMKYGKEFAETCRKNGLQNVNEKVVAKLSMSAPAKVLVENYMLEISKSYKVPFQADPANLLEEQAGDLISLSHEAGEAAQSASYPPILPHHQPPTLPDHTNQPAQPFNYPSPQQHPYPLYPIDPPYPNHQFPQANPFQMPNLPSQPPAYMSTLPDAGPLPPKLPELPPNNSTRPSLSNQITWDDNQLPLLPDVPSFSDNNTTNNKSNNDTIDFDDLSRRFQELKKKK